MTKELCVVQKEKKWVWWVINSCDYLGMDVFAEKSGIPQTISNLPLINSANTIQFTEMRGAGELIAEYFPPTGNWVFFDINHTTISFDTVSRTPNAVQYVVKCRNNRFILLNDHSFEYLERYYGGCYDASDRYYEDIIADYNHAYYYEFADDTTPDPIFQTQDYVYWVSDINGSNLVFGEEDSSHLGAFDTCRGQVVERFYHQHIYSFTHFEDITGIYFDDGEYDYQIDAVPLKYEGWVYGVATKVNGVTYMLWTPEESLKRLDLSQVYDPFLDYGVEDDCLVLPIGELSEFNRTRGKYIDALLMIDFYSESELEKLESELYERIPF